MSGPRSHPGFRGFRGFRDLWIAVLVWMFVLITPFPQGSAGSIQLSHGFVALMLIASLTRREFANVPLVVPLSWLLFVAYVLVCSAIWSSLLGDIEPLIYASPIVLGVLVFLAFLVEIRRDAKSMLAILKWACFLALLSQVVMVSTASWIPGGARGTLQFANPNQLAYFSVLAGSLFLASHQVRDDAGPVLTWVAVGCTLILVAFSGSKAGLLGGVALAMLAVLGQKRGRYAALALLFAAIIFLLPLVWELMSTWGRAMFVFGQQDDSLAGRGYDRFWRFPHYLVMGAGEGVFQRFSGPYNVEIHSTIGAVLFSYGIVGTGLLVAAVVFSLDSCWRGLAYMVPVMAYGVAHNGIRQPFFWVLLAVAVSYGYATACFRSRGGRAGHSGIDRDAAQAAFES